jgi:hypothetical protein
MASTAKGEAKGKRDRGECRSHVFQGALASLGIQKRFRPKLDHGRGYSVPKDFVVLTAKGDTPPWLLLSASSTSTSASRFPGQRWWLSCAEDKP